jgi:Short C-terminal domain
VIDGHAPARGPGIRTPSRARSARVDVADQLRKLAELRDQGVLTDDEFAAQKTKLLGA